MITLFILLNVVCWYLWYKDKDKQTLEELLLEQDSDIYGFFLISLYGVIAVLDIAVIVILFVWVLP